MKTIAYLINSSIRKYKSSGDLNQDKTPADLDSNENKTLKHRGKTRQKVRKLRYLQSLRMTRSFSFTQRLVSVILIISIFSTFTFAMPGASRNVAVSANELGEDVRFGLAAKNYGLSLFSTDILSSVLRYFKSDQKTVEQIIILPSDENESLTILQGEKINFTAIGLSENQPISGLSFDWSVVDTSGNRSPKPLNNGIFNAEHKGIFVVTASVGGSQSQITVKVMPNEGIGVQKILTKNNVAKKEKERQYLSKIRTENKLIDREINSKNDFDFAGEELRNQIFKQKMLEVKTRQEQRRRQQPNPFSNSENDKLKNATPEGNNRAENDSQSENFEAQTNISDPNYLSETRNGRKRGPNAEDNESENLVNAMVSSMLRPLDEDGWNGNNWWTADDPNNGVGNPPTTSPDVGAGNGNFRITAPVIAMPGRGLDVNLSLTYNSRLWSKSGNTMSFDSDKGDPAPGWNLGFGKMIYMGSNGGCMLVDGDGTRRGYSGTNSTYSYGSYFSNSFTGHTADGSFIDYNCYYSSSTYGTSLSGSVSLPNGVKIFYGSQSLANDQVYPTQITDTQGNYIIITYRNNRGPQISTVTDTMGRIINFNYDSLNRLVSVTVPGFNGGAARTAVRLHYTTLALNYGFAGGITTDTNNNYPYVLDAIYYPGTNTGYWFGDSDSYSSYGMIAKVKEMRGMTSTGTTNDQGSVTAGTMSKQEVYDFPLTPNYSLTDAPTYSNFTESWDGMDTAPLVTNYLTFMNSSPRTITVTHPNGLKSKQYMYNAAGLWNDGLIYQDETLDSGNNVISKSEVTWQAGVYDTARPIVSIVTDEQQNTKKTELTYGTVYNQVISKKEYDYNNGPLLRENRIVYENNAAYTSRHIFNLIKSNEIYDGAGTRVAKTDYEYDNNLVNGGNLDLKETSGVIMHFSTYDPYTTETQNGFCINGQWNNYQCEYEGQLVWVGQYGYEEICHYECYEYEQVSVYDPATGYRGNVSKVTGYADAVNASGAIQETRKYDVTGNVVAQSNSTSNPVTEVVNLNFDISTQYAYPISQTEGSPDPNSPHRNTISSVYDFNTGLIKQITDKNGRVNSVTFNPDNLRPTVSTSSTGSYQQTFYNDAGMTVTEEAREYGGNLASKNVKYLNGVGQVKREETLGINNTWDITETKYNNLGQVWKQSRPYRTGDTIQWTENVFDIQGRVTQVIEADGSTVQAFYNETSRPSSASNLPGQTVRTVDAWGRERWERYDKDSKLVELVEPDPNGNGSVMSAGNLVTKYKTDVMGRMIETEQGGQFRYFKYNSLGQLIRQKLAEQTATLNDAGQYVGAGNSQALWSEAAWYDDQANITLKVDARGVKTYYSYQINGVHDPLNRLQSKAYDISGPIDPNQTIHNSPSVIYTYMTSGDRMRVQQIRTDGILTENYSYDIEGRVSDYTQTIDYRTNYPMTISYIYDSLDRIADVRYPAQYGITGNPRKLVHNSYDTASRLTNLTYDGQQQAGNIVYDAADRATSINIGAGGTNQVTELYTYNAQNGLLTNQKVMRNGQSLMDLSYDYQRNSSNGTINGTTGHLTKILDNLNHNRDREYKYDAIGRLNIAKGGINSALWQQTYNYDRFGNRTNVTATGVAADNSAIPRDGLANMSYNSASNRITTAGFEYDSAGNQTRALAEDGVTWLRFEYDAANRLLGIKKDDGTPQQSFQYSAGNQRLMSFDYVAYQLTIFAAYNGSVFAEYTEFAHTVPTWTKSYTYLGGQILGSISPNGQGGETVEYNHPDRLGTRIVTNQQAGTSFEQQTLPFGTALNAESSGSTVRRFTSYERSNRTNLDYALNRTYDSKQGRFTQVDPIGMSSVDLRNPQTLNLYSYCANDPINHTDADGLFFGFLKKFFSWLAKALKWIALAVAIVALVIIIATFPGSFTLLYAISLIGAAATVAEQVFTILGLKTLSTIFGIIGAAASFGTNLLDKAGKLITLAKDGVKAILGAIKAGASLASKVLTAFGQKTAAGIMGFINAIAGAIDGILKQDALKDSAGKFTGFKYSLSKDFFAWYKSIRSAAQATATLVGAKNVANVLGAFSFITDVQDIVNAGINIKKALSAKEFKDYATGEGKDKIKNLWKGDESNKTFINYHRVNNWAQAHFYLNQVNTIAKTLSTTHTNLNKK